MVAMQCDSLQEVKLMSAMLYRPIFAVKCYKYFLKERNFEDRSLKMRRY